MKPKIFFIASGWLQQSGGGGIRTATIKLLNNFPEGLFQFCLLDLEIGEDFRSLRAGELGLEKNIKFIPLNLPNIKIGRVYIPIWLLFVPKVLLTIKSEKPKIICHITNPNIKVILFFLIKLFFPSVIQIFIEHIHPLTYIKKTSHFKKLILFFLPFSYRRVTAIVSVSKEMKWAIIQELKIHPAKVRLIYNPVVDSSIKNKSKEAINHPWYAGNTPIILSIARLDPIQKDFPTLLKAFYKTRMKIPLKLVIVGDGPQKRELERLATELGINDQVWFAGYQENPYKFLARSSLLVLSSRFESFGVVLIEGMACGIPVVASDCDFGPREIIKDGENGMLFPVGDINKLAEKIEFLISHREVCRKFIKNGKRMAAKFAVDQVIKKYRLLFNGFS